MLIEKKEVFDPRLWLRGIKKFSYEPGDFVSPEVKHFVDDSGVDVEIIYKMSPKAREQKRLGTIDKQYYFIISINGVEITRSHSRSVDVLEQSIMSKVKTIKKIIQGIDKNS